MNLKNSIPAVGITSGRARSKTARGMTLPELMVAVVVGALILTILGQVFVSSAFSFSAMGNYVGMDSNSRLALDRMSREIRQAGNLLEFSTNHLKFSLQGQTNSFLTYDWDAQSRQLTESKSADGTSKVLLTECDQLAFSMSDSLFAPTIAIAEGKGIRVAWKCSRTALGKKSTTEDMEQALIVMRNKPL